MAPVTLSYLFISTSYELPPLESRQNLSFWLSPHSMLQFLYGYS